MNTIEKTVVVAGHICLDIFPDMTHLPPGQLMKLLQPGHLILTKGVALCTGGPVSNTGLSLHLLGVPVHLIARIGDDPFGWIVRKLVEQYGVQLAQGLRVEKYSSTSYSIILSAPEVDRIFLHSPGANDEFGMEDIDESWLSQASLFHFGYPPVMKRMVQNRGEELTKIFREVKSFGLTTSLDMALPDPQSEGGKVDWREILGRLLPYVDIFSPSFEELLFMLHRQEWEEFYRTSSSENILRIATPERMSLLGEELVTLGAKIVLLKMGDQGVYLKTSSNWFPKDFGKVQPVPFDEWQNREIRGACFQVNVMGTTGAGDATIAGFLAAFLRGFSPVDAMNAALAVGASNVEAEDALSGIRGWSETLSRIQAGWQRRDLLYPLSGWMALQDGIWEKINQEKN